MSKYTERMERVRAALCYRSRTWSLITLPAEAKPGWDVAVERTKDLIHDAAGLPVEHWLASAYLQGLIDGQQVAAAMTKVKP